jgi:hypothetical protein
MLFNLISENIQDYLIFNKNKTFKNPQIKSSKIKNGFDCWISVINIFVINDQVINLFYFLLFLFIILIRFYLIKLFLGLSV